jgi:hypothetical protein
MASLSSHPALSHADAARQPNGSATVTANTLDPTTQ